MNDSLRNLDLFRAHAALLGSPDFVILTFLLMSVLFTGRTRLSLSLSFSDVRPRYLRVSLDLITIYERDSADLRSRESLNHPDDNNDDDATEVPLSLARSFCRDPETGGLLSSKSFCFDPQ